MTIHERITTDMLELYDEGQFSKDNLEYLIKELLNGDEMYSSLLLDYQALKKDNAYKESVIEFLKKEIEQKNRSGK